MLPHTLFESLTTPEDTFDQVLMRQQNTLGLMLRYAGAVDHVLLEGNANICSRRVTVDRTTSVQSTMLISIYLLLRPCDRLVRKELLTCLCVPECSLATACEHTRPLRAGDHPSQALCQCQGVTQGPGYSYVMACASGGSLVGMVMAHVMP